MQTIVLRNPQALENPDLVAFLRRAFTSFPHAAGKTVGLEGVIEDIFSFIKDPDFYMILGVENGEFTTLAVLQKGASKLFPYPTVFCFYNEGTAAAKRGVVAHILEIVRELGYTRFRTANMSGHSDEVWERGFKRDGVGITPIGTIFEMTLE